MSIINKITEAKSEYMRHNKGLRPTRIIVPENKFNEIMEKITSVGLTTRILGMEVEIGDYLHARSDELLDFKIVTRNNKRQHQP